jgi:hypothetical protein
VLDGRAQTIGAALAEERGHLLPRATEGFDLGEVVFPVVDKQGCVTVKTNFYSMPVRAGSRVEARSRPLHVEIWHSGRMIARHERCHQRRQHVLDLEHYLDVLAHKPGALAGSKPLAQWRAAGRWPACYDELWNRLRQRHGRQDGTRAMVAVLALGQELGHERLRTAVAAARDELLAVWRIESAAAERSLLDNGSLTSTFTVYGRDGRPTPVSGAWDDDGGKDGLFGLVSLIAIAEGAAAITWVSESWIVLGTPNLDLPPSNSERRQEVLLSAVVGRESDTGEVIHYASIRRMDRDFANKLFAFSDMELPADVEAQGRLVELLPPEILTLADRRRARELIRRATKRIRRGRPPFVE